MILQPIEIQDRHNVTTDGILGAVPQMDGFKLVRTLTPLVLSALMRSNNPLVTGKRGFEAMGIDVDGMEAGEVGMALMPKTLEVLVLLMCSREELKAYAKDPVLLDEKTMDLLEEIPIDKMPDVTELVSSELSKVGVSSVSRDTEKDAPSASTIEEAKKKQDPTP